MADRPWGDEERACAVRSSSFEDFDAVFPGRTRDAWKVKRNRMLRGAVPVRGDGRERNGAAKKLAATDRLLRAAELVAPKPEPKPVRAAVQRHPKGWEPGVAWDGKMGEITSPATTEAVPDWNAILLHFNLDAAEYEVIEPVQMRTWDAAVGDGEVRQMWYYRASFQKRRRSAFDLDELVALVESRHCERRPAAIADDPRGYVVGLSDWQLGKALTTEATAAILGALDEIAEDVTRLRAAGRALETLYLVGVGDVVEGCTGFYDQQEFTVELTRREQTRLARRLIFAYIDRLAPLFARVVVAAIGGNHGENRSSGAKGKSFTTFGDNDDVAVFEQVAEACAVNPAVFGHVSFVLPENELTLTLDVHGAVLGIAHGHQSARTGPEGVEKWWAGQAYGQQPVGDAAVLLTGHAHWFSARQNGPRTHFQCPTMDRGSQWFREKSGLESTPGTLVFTLNREGWDNLRVLRGA